MYRSLESGGSFQDTDKSDPSGPGLGLHELDHHQRQTTQLLYRSVMGVLRNFRRI